MFACAICMCVCVCVFVYEDKMIFFGTLLGFLLSAVIRLVNDLHGLLPLSLSGLCNLLLSPPLSGLENKSMFMNDFLGVCFTRRLSSEAETRLGLFGVRVGLVVALLKKLISTEESLPDTYDDKSFRNKNESLNLNL